MALSVGLLLPRSTDYPALGFEILDGLRCSLSHLGETGVQFVTENIGYGEDHAVNYARAEKMLLQDNVQVMIVYANASNAEALYGLAESSGRPFIFLDAGMQLPHNATTPQAYHISLQGVHACRLAGNMAGAGNKKVLMATSFYDGGYRGPWGYVRGLEEAGGKVCGNYVSGFKEASFTIEPYLELLQNSGAESVGACFSTYLGRLFIKALKEKNPDAVSRPFYCSPFMAEEQFLAACDFPGGIFYAIVPWASTIENEAQYAFKACIQQEKNKAATIFHLLGWEAGSVAVQATRQGATSLAGFSYQSPRGEVTIHPDTHYTYAPLYKGVIGGDSQGRCALQVEELLPVTAAQHELVMNDRPGAVASGWRNNYLCI